MVVLTLLQKIYGTGEADARKIFSEILATITSGLEAQATFIGKNTRNWIQVEVSGVDTNVAVNYLRRRFGLAVPVTDIYPPKILKGKIVDSGKVGYGVYVDIETYTSSSIDVLIPLHRLRSHLGDGRKLPLREIIDAFCLRDNFPLAIRLTKVHPEEKRMWAEPSDEQVEMFRKWISTYLDRIIVLGAHRGRIILALKRSGVGRDIVKVDELGFLEYALLCKLGTNVTRVIKVLGQHLSGVPLYPFLPRKVKGIIGEPLPSIGYGAA